ncbi:MAG: CapA family protein [Chloroflexi bacterium]|nr:CapA family protein [Chloroflexota bacterium]
MTSGPRHGLNGRIDQSLEQPSLSIVLTGQSLIQSDIRVETPTAVKSIRPLLQGDVVFTNFEATIREKADSLADLGRARGIYAPPEALDALEELGFNLLAASNNHAFDLGRTGILNTVRGMRSRKLVYAGIGENLDEALAPGYLRTANRTVAIVSMASGRIQPGAPATESGPGLNEIRLEGGTPNVHAGRPNEEVARLTLRSISEAAKHADLVIACHHNHAFDKEFVTMMKERLPERLVPPNWMKRWAHAEIDAGADIVVSHGAPLVQGVEIYRGRPIFYDMGNFIFQLPLAIDPLEYFEPNVWESVVAHVSFRGRILESVSFQPIALNVQGRGEGELFLATRGLPASPSGSKAREILRRLVDSSLPFGTKIVINGGTAELLLNGEAVEAQR